MPSIRAAIASIKRPSIAQQHESLLATITDREQRLRESPAIKAAIGHKRERLRAAENQLPKLSAALRGLSEPHWAAQAQTTREEMSALRREIEDLAAEIAADEAALSEIASAALPEVTPALLAFHRERAAEAKAAADKIRDALEVARGELQAIEATPGPAADLRRQLEAALAGLALGTTTQDEVDSLEAGLSESESIASITGTKAKRIKATIAGLEARLTQAQGDLDRLNSITPALQWEVLTPELGQAEAGYRDALDALVQASDRYRALVTLMSGIRPGTTQPPLPEATAALRDPGQTRLAAALEREQERLASLI
jgi:chromosome segregation ATPase